MTTDQRTQLGRKTLFLYALGFCLVTVVLFSPHAGSWEGRSFFVVAQSSPWERWWDWAAAWCSVKIMLLSAGILSLIVALGMWLKLLQRESLGRVVLLLSAAPGMGVWVGFYYLVKALL